MRSFKFRSWDIETKEMSYDFLNKHWFKVAVESPYMLLMQYTGLKNIYEGDVLDCLYPERGEHGDIMDYSNYTGVVVWDESTYKFVLKCSLGNEYLEHLLRPTVIGNIYENPELLEV